MLLLIKSVILTDLVDLVLTRYIVSVFKSISVYIYLILRNLPLIRLKHHTLYSLY